MCRVWLRLAMMSIALSFAAVPAMAQEGEAAPVPPWGETLEESGEAADEGVMQRLLAWPEDHSARIWVKPEYVLGFIHSSRLPPLLTTGLTTDASPGAIGNPYTKILYGDTPVDFQDRSGFRITVGGVINVERSFSIEGSYLTLGGRQQGVAAGSPGNPILARPFFDVVSQANDSSLTTYPGFLSGGIAISNSSYLQSFELNGLLGLYHGRRLRVRGLFGLRHIGLRESLFIQESATVTDAASPQVGQAVHVVDSFSTTNNFYAGQVGLAAEHHWRRWTTTLFGKVALGDLEERVAINGATAFQGNVTPGGLLALSSNIGTYRRERLGVAPEAGVNLQAALGKHITFNVGYSFLYLGNVVRPGYQVDLGINPNLVPTSGTFGGGGPQRPAFAFNESDYWAHLFNFGLTFQY
jgi:hypothetical protein